MKFSEFINEKMGDRTPKPKMLTIGNLVKVLKEDKNWSKYVDEISDFFEQGSWSKGDYVGSSILELMFGDDYSWQEEYDLPEKKSTWSTCDKRLRGALKKIDKEYVIDKASCYKRIKHALDEDGDVFSDMAYAIRDKNKNKGVNVSYPKFDSYGNVASWLLEFEVANRMIGNCSKDDICLLLTEGIGSISITPVEHNEYISVGSRTSTQKTEYKIDVVSYSTNKTVSFNVSKSKTNRV